MQPHRFPQQNNTDTGHLVSPERYEAMRKALEAAGETGPAYTPVPKRLAQAARRKLAGRSEAMVSLTSGGKLSLWAARRRAAKNAAKKRASRRAMEKATRKAQR